MRRPNPAVALVTAMLLCLATSVEALGAPADQAAQAGQTDRSDRTERTDEGTDGAGPRSHIVVLADGVETHGETDRLERAHGFRAAHRYRAALRGFAARLSDQQVQRLRDDPEVLSVVPDRPVHISATVDVASGERVPTGLLRIGVATETVTRAASGARVAVVDTGVDLDHPDLEVAAGKNCVGSTPPDDDHGHGTHVAGTIAARNTGAGVIGVAPGTTIVPVKVLDGAGNGTWSQVICGVDWITSTRTDADPANDVEVANLSLGGSGSPMSSCATTTDPLHRAVCAATAEGVTLVVAAGNDGWDFDYPAMPDVPAVFPEVLTVSAVADSDGAPGGVGGAPSCDTRQTDDRVATFSNFALTAAGAAHLVAAPGSCIRSTWPGGYATLSGTSMATPHVTGLVALCLDEDGEPGPCAGLAPAAVIDAVRLRAADHAAVSPGDGFVGSPASPLGARVYGHLASPLPSADAGSDDEPEPPSPPQVAIADASFREPPTGTVVRTFEVSLSAASTSPVTVAYATSNGTAVAPGDYKAATGTLTFAPGDTHAIVPVTVVGDGLNEAVETMKVTLSAPSGATLGRAVATGSILGPPPKVRVADTSVGEGVASGQATFTVTLSAASPDEVPVAFATADSTAVAPHDYTAVAGTLTFAPGERTKTVAVPIVNDTIDELSEKLTISLTAPADLATVADGLGVATITDNDAVPAITIADAGVVEGDTGVRYAVVTVSLSSPSGRTVSVSRVTQDGTAKAGIDYTALAASRIAFSPGETSRTISVAVRGDVKIEADERFSVVLSSAANATIGRAKGFVTITDDD